MIRSAIGFSVAIVVTAGAWWYLAGARVPAATPPWERMAPMPTPRSEMAGAELDGIVYVPGGFGALTATLSTFESYDPSEDTWTTLPSLPSGVHHAGVAAAGGLVFVMGGFSGLDFSSGTDSVWAYDPARSAWQELDPMPGRRGAHALVALDDVVYVVGGVGDAPQEVWAYEVATGTWSTDHAPLPAPREHLAAVAHGGRIYAIAGRWRGVGNLATMAAYEPGAGEWSDLPDMEHARSGLTAAVADGRIHVAGGEDLQAGVTLDSHEIFDAEAGAWEPGVPLVAPRHGLASAVVDGTWYLIGGATGPGAETFVSLTPTVDALDVGRGR
jgi:hypothetical protein